MTHLKKTTLALVASSLLSGSIAWATPAQILLIRHGEKPDTGNQLSDIGLQRAQALRAYFETNPAVTKYGTPVAIFAMKQDGPDGSVRPIQTVTPLAADLKTTINEDYLKNDFQGLAKEILSNPAYNGKMVLICWEHKVIPDIAQELGVTPRPADWKGTDFWTVFEIDYTAAKVSNFKTFSEHLLPGDQ